MEGNPGVSQTLFEGKRGPKPLAAHREPELLYSEIGKLKVGLDWLKKKSTLIDVSQVGHAPARAQEVAQARQKGYPLPTCVSSKATVWPGLEVEENRGKRVSNTADAYGAPLAPLMIS